MSLIWLVGPDFGGAGLTSKDGGFHLRILQVISRYWPYNGGAEKHVQEISERLVRDGHEVTVYTTDAYDLDVFWSPVARRVAERTEEHNGVRIVRFPVRHLPVPRVSFGGLRYGLTLLSRSRLVPSPLLEGLSLLAPRLPEYRRALAAETARYDVVHGLNICFEGMLWPALRFARRTGAGFAVTPLIHLGEGPSSVVRQYYTMRHQMALLSNADAVFAETPLEAEYIRRHTRGARVQVIGSGVNAAELAGGDGERFRAAFGVSNPFVYYIGTAAFDKGTVHLIEAMRALWNDGVTADLVIAGPSLGAFDVYFQGLPADVRARCHRVGIVSEQEKRDLIAASALFAMPSRTDSFGITYLEAWVCGKPVIGARAGGVPDVISDGQDGFLVPFGDVPALAGRIRQLLADADLSQHLGENGRRKVAERYTWDVLYPRLRDELASTVKRRSGSDAPSAKEAT